MAIFILYVLWYFIDQNKSWRAPYFIFSIAVIGIVSIQRIYADAHNDVGLLLSFLISLLGIIVSRWDYIKGKFSF
jgi:hypothetical protein